MQIQAIRAGSLAVAGLVLAAAALAWPGRGPRDVAASPRAAEVAAAGGRIVFDPGGPIVWIEKVRPGAGGDRTPPDIGGMLVQNLGDRPTRLLSLDDVSIDPPTSCTRCAIRRALCSERIAPGATWQVSTTVAVLSLSDQPAADAGAGWADAAGDLGLPAGATVADVVCTHVARWPREAECPAAAFIEAFAGGGPTDALPAGLDAAAARGEPIGGVMRRPRFGIGGPVPGTDNRFEALGLADVGWAPFADDAASRGRFVYDLPGAWIQSPDGLASALHLLNPTASCATIVVSAYRTSNGFRGAFTATLSAGAMGGFALDDVAEFEEVFGSAALRVVSDRPLAASLEIYGPHFTTIAPAIHMPDAALAAPTLRQLMPLAYQEKVEFAADDAADVAAEAAAGRADATAPGPVVDIGVGADTRRDAPAQAPLDRARGWESNIPVFNPYPERLELGFRLQAEGEPRREFAYPLLPRVQTVFQPGFGLGKPGGDGWGELAARAPLALPLSIAVHGWRTASDEPAVIEGWAARTWAFDEAAPAPRYIGLPDLGGPAVAAPDDPDAPPLALHGAMTDTFGARIALQNPLTRTARIAIDSYAAACGFAGTVEHRIDPRQRLLVDVRDLPGTAHGANAAVVRVLDGAVAAMVEFRRPGWPTLAAAPPDVASAYLGTPVDAADAGPAPANLAARLAVTPTAVTVDRSALAPIRVLAAYVPDDARCARYRAATDAPWLAIDAPAGPLPSVLTLTVDPRRLPSGDAVGIVTVSSDDATMAGSPQQITVRVTGEPVHRDPGRAYLPLLWRDAGR